MKKILVFSFFPAFVPPSNGGESRLFNFYKSLSQFHYITLLTSSHYDVAEEKIYHGSNFIERRIPKDSHFVTKWNEFTPYASGGDLSAISISESGCFPTLLHSAYLEEYNDADIIIHDFPFTVDYDLFFGIDNKMRIYNAHNCESILYKTLHKDDKSQPIWDSVTQAETKMLEGCDAVLYCNESDLDAFNELTINTHYLPVFTPNGMSPLSNVDRNFEDKKISSIVFIGSGHPPNVEAALKIVENIAPVLPDIKFHIIGGCLPEGRYAKNVIRHGFVEEGIKQKLIMNADLAINPMGAGSGSNVKVFDFFSYAIPILSTDFGMRGIQATNERDCLIAPIEDFPKVIQQWSGCYDELQEIGKNGQALAEAKYSWDVIAEHVSEAFLEIEKKHNVKNKYVLALNDYDSFNNNGGGGVRTREIYNEVSTWSSVVFLCFSDDDKLTVRRENNNITIFSIPKTSSHIEELQTLNSYFHISVDDIVAHRQCHLNKIFVSTYNILKKLSRSILVEHPYLATIPLSFNDRFIYSSQNFETQIKRDLLKYHPFYDELVNEVTKMERDALENASAIIAVSEQDAYSFVEGVRTAGPVVVAHNGASEPTESNKEDLVRVNEMIDAKRAVVFVGSAHMPNVEAVKYIVEQMAPNLLNIEFHIVGSVCDCFSQDGSTNIKYWGIVSESLKSAIMQTCHVAINTVISGGGSNIKLADYFANGLYVVTTPFGLRGYPAGTPQQVIKVGLGDFKSGIQKALLKSQSENKECRGVRKKFFDDYLSMRSKAKKVVALLKSFEKPKKRILLVTYRYTYPILGGAESMIENLIEALDNSDSFQIDVVSPEVTKIENINRFSENYTFDEKTSSKINLNNVRFARFPIDQDVDVSNRVISAWQSQPIFEKQLYQSLRHKIDVSGLAWGWGEPEGDEGGARWSFTECGIHLQEESDVSITGYTARDTVITVKDDKGRIVTTKKVNGGFKLLFSCCNGEVDISSSIARIDGDDVRPLAFYMTSLSFNGECFDLTKPKTTSSVGISDIEKFRMLDEACKLVRDPLNINLSKMRGPFSSSMEAYIELNVHEYDLIVTHNNVFKPAVDAVELANKAGVPVISIPHAHLDDDYYHFPDVHKSIIKSDLVLAAPKVACDFYENKGANVSYLPAGINASEIFSEKDVGSFKKVCLVKKPFVLVLGRKSNAKGYQKVINAVEQLSKNTDIHLVMIGPDDDGLPVNSSCVTYLGMQTREVIRGALLSCESLINMSSSESFGIVLLEAWMAGKPVIVNNACAAFHDLATDDFNALMVNDSLSLQEAIQKIISEPLLCERLAKNGKEILKDYDWKQVGSLFVRLCHDLINKSHAIISEEE